MQLAFSGFCVLNFELKNVWAYLYLIVTLQVKMLFGCLLSGSYGNFAKTPAENLVEVYMKSETKKGPRLRVWKNALRKHLSKLEVENRKFGSRNPKSASLIAISFVLGITSTPYLVICSGNELGDGENINPFAVPQAMLVPS